MKSLKSKIIERMGELGIQPKRSLGQNFLISEHVVSRIINAAQPSQFVKTFEIGPGLGALTDDLVQESQDLTLLELDSQFATYWRGKELNVVEGDALAFPWDKLPWQDGPYLLVSNLPYQISSRLVVELSFLEFSFTRMVLMFQKEVALRLLASPGEKDYGLLSVVAQCFWDMHMVVEAGSIDFMPKPNVASRVVAFNSRSQVGPKAKTPDFLKFLKLAFANRRKKLLPKLTSYGDKKELEKVFQQLQLAPDVRAERLSPEQWIELYLFLKKEY